MDERQAKWRGMTEDEKQEARAKMAHSTQYAKDAYADLFGVEGEDSDADAR